MLQEEKDRLQEEQERLQEEQDRLQDEQDGQHNFHDEQRLPSEAPKRGKEGAVIAERIRGGGGDGAKEDDITKVCAFFLM